MRSIFTDKISKPSKEDLQKALGNSFEIWQALEEFTKNTYPEPIEEWHFASEKFGWSFRIKDKKRVLIYLLPRDNFFKIAFVFGQKATDAILKSDIAQNIKTEIENAKVYAEGRGIRIEVKDKSNIKDLEELIKIKISN